MVPLQGGSGGRLDSSRQTRANRPNPKLEGKQRSPKGGPTEKGPSSQPLTRLPAHWLFTAASPEDECQGHGSLNRSAETARPPANQLDDKKANIFTHLVVTCNELCRRQNELTFVLVP